MPPDALTSDSDLDTVLEEFKLQAERRKSVPSADGGDGKEGPKYTCSICQEKFKRLDQLDRHEYHHTGLKRHACTYDGCDKSYSILTHLRRHLRTTHERPEAAAQKTIKCSVLECEKMFTSSSNMQRHVRDNHESPREYPCAHCPLKFSQKLKLKRHEIREHTQQYPFRCEKCERGFYQQWQQESHQQSCKQYSYKCPGCPLEFAKWSLYTKHCRDTLHGRKRHRCVDCGQSFDKPSDLKQHRDVKHQEEPKSFACPKEGCSRSYSYERNLRQHLLSSHKGRRFECQALNCGRDFSSGQNLAKHLGRDHAKQAQTEPKPPATRKRRRDAGKSKHSRLAKLSYLQLDKETEEAVRQRDPTALEEIMQQLLETEDVEID